MDSKYQDKDIHPPARQKIQHLIAQNPDMGDLSFEKGNSLRNTNPSVSLNFGAFAKGYAIELEMEKLKKMGINNAIINAGGDLSVIGMRGDRAWNIGIRHPRENSIIASVEVKTMKVFSPPEITKDIIFTNPNAFTIFLILQQVILRETPVQSPFCMRMPGLRMPLLQPYLSPAVKTGSESPEICRSAMSCSSTLKATSISLRRWKNELNFIISRRHHTLLSVRNYNFT